MPDKPTTASGYGPEFLDRARRTCLHLATVIGDLTDDVVLVGGLAPSLLVPQGELPSGADPHVGTLDVDVGLALGLLDAGRYQELSERLRRAGFGPDVNASGQRTRQRWVWRKARGVSVDFLIPPSTPTDRGGTIRDLEQDFAALITPGLPLAFRDRKRVILDGETLLGERAVREIWVCGPAAYVALKALAFRSRGENKDAYDLHYVLRNYGDGPRSVAGAFLALLDSPIAREALAILEADFTSPDSLGAMRVAAFLARRDDPAFLTDAAGFAREFVRLCSTRR
jgi:hypothetical protein